MKKLKYQKMKLEKSPRKQSKKKTSSPQKVNNRNYREENNGGENYQQSNLKNNFPRFKSRNFQIPEGPHPCMSLWNFRTLVTNRRSYKLPGQWERGETDNLNQITLKAAAIRKASEISTATLQASKQWNNDLKILEENYFQMRILTQKWKGPFKNDSKMKTFS